MTFANAANLYLDAGKPDRFIGRVASYWQDTPVKQITAGAIRQSAIDLYPKASGATRNRQVIVPTQAIINHAADLELCGTVKVRRFPVERHEKEPATWEWVQAFMAHANPHLGALACFMFLTGARITEALSVTWEDIDFKTSTVLIRQTKTKKERRAHMPGPLVVALANITDRQETVFKYSSRSTARPQWNKAVRRAGIKRLSFHACRHGFATAMLHAGVDPITIAKRGGWDSPQHVVGTYGHAMDDPTVTERIIDTPRVQSATRKRKDAINE